MFEKEAEEYIKKNNLEWELECNRISPVSAVFQAYQDGAELGYNKAKEENAELEEKYTTLQEKCNSLQELVNYYQTNFCQEG